MIHDYEKTDNNDRCINNSERGDIYIITYRRIEFVI